MRMLPFLLAASTLPATGAQAQTSGQYGPLTVAVIGNEVRGVFSEARTGNGTDEAPQFSCIFLIRGTLGAGRGVVRTWYPGEHPIKGSLAFRGKQVSLMTEDNHGGCLNTSGDMTREPYRTDLGSAGKGWIGVALIRARRAVLRAAPGAPAKGPYVVDAEAVGILERRAGWLRVAYLAGAKPVTGWVRTSEVAIAE